MAEIASPAAVLAQVEHCLQMQGRAVLCQIVRAEGSTPGKAGWKLLARPDGTFFGNLGGGAFEALVQADALEKLRPRPAGEGEPGSELKRYYLTERATRGEATGMVCGGMAEVFLEVLTAPPVLVVCGGGPVGQAVAKAGELAGFELLVVDDRPDFRDPGLFPAGTRVEAVDREYRSSGGEDFLAPVAGRDLYVAVLTRCWETDTAALAAVLRQAPPRLRYVGLMGSRRKVARVRDEVAALGVDLGRLEEAGLPLHAPIGLPIGGDTPGEIAISILAEVLRSRHRGERPDEQDRAAEDAQRNVHEERRALQEMVGDALEPQ